MGAGGVGGYLWTWDERGAVMKVLITGGAGFIGANLAERCMKRGDKVLIVDNLSRRGAEKNLDWLRTIGPFEWIDADIRDRSAMAALMRAHRDVDVVYHLAAQVAVTTSITDPLTDFEINAAGTLNLLHATIEAEADPIFLFSSTNKVYGDLTSIPVSEDELRYRWADERNGIDESQGLDFHSPYGCSKGAADQYVLDFSRIYGLRGVVLRQSCIYGERQFGVEDQGWVAWFGIASMLGLPMTLYGSGKQVRDLLHVGDLLDAYDASIEHIEECRGKAFNTGGGLESSMSILELLNFLSEYFGRELPSERQGPRQGDQLIFVSDNSRLERATGWKPKVPLEDGLRRLLGWLDRERDILEPIHRTR